MFFTFEKFGGCVFLFLFVAFVHIIQANVVPKAEVGANQYLSQVIVESVVHNILNPAREQIEFYRGVLITKKTILTSALCASKGKDTEMHAVIGKLIVDVKFEHSININIVLIHEKFILDFNKYDIAMFLTQENMIEDKAHLAKIKRSIFTIKEGTKVNYGYYKLNLIQQLEYKSSTETVVRCDKTQKRYTNRSMCVSNPEDQHSNPSGIPIFLIGKSKPTVIGIVTELFKVNCNYLFTIQTGCRGIYNWIKKNKWK